MRFAYADPPYPGQARKHYADHPDYAGEVDHGELLRRLNTYDGWVLHTASTTLSDVLLIAADNGVAGFRVMAWVKPFAAFKRNVSVAYAWEPVLVKPVRKPVVSGRVVMRDWLAESITLRRGLTGAKPEAVCRWVFEVAGLDPDDDLTDLYVERAALAAAARLESEVSQLRTQLAACSEAFAALSADKPDTGHPETTCERCQRPNVWSWHAPSPLWNAVMRDPVTGEDAWSIVCPPCFADLAERKGLGGPVLDGRPRWTWHFGPHEAEVDIAGLWQDRDGRQWDAASCLWVADKPDTGLDVERAYTLLISSTPALLRAWRDSPNQTARDLNAVLHDAVVEWCRAYQAATGRGDQGLQTTAAYTAVNEGTGDG